MNVSFSPMAVILFYFLLIDGWFLLEERSFLVLLFFFLIHFGTICLFNSHTDFGHFLKYNLSDFVEVSITHVAIPVIREMGDLH